MSSIALPKIEIKKEFANALSHGLGVLFGVVAIPVLLTIAAKSGETKHLVGASIYGFSFLMVFAFSTLYHGIQHPFAKRILQICDHISIYFLIAGSYTPFILAYMYNAQGIAMLSVLWGLTFVGIFFKIFFTGRFNLLSTIIYLVMGWMILTLIKPFIAGMSSATFTLLAIGGGLYTLGVIFFLWKKVTYHHAIWHIFVLAAAICHFVAVLISVT